MLVIDLIEQLKKMDPTAVVYYQGDDEVLHNHPGYVVVKAESSTVKTVDYDRGPAYYQNIVILT
jgi:hypothetical protein